MYERTISIFTFSKTYAMTGLRLGYVTMPDATLRERMKKVLFYSAGNVSSVVQFGAIGALEGSQESVPAFRDELEARRDLFYEGIVTVRRACSTASRRRGLFTRSFGLIHAGSRRSGGRAESRSWQMAEFLISRRTNRMRAGR